MNRLLRLGVLSLFLGFFFYTGFSGVALHASEKRVLEESQLQGAITRHIERHTNWPKGTIRVSFPYGLPELSQVLEHYNLEVKENPKGEFIGNRSWSLKVRQKDNVYRQLSLSALVEVSREVAVSSRPLERGKTISPEDITVQKKWFSRLPQELLTEPGSIVGKRLLRSLREGTSFTAGMLSEPLMLKKGKVVKIVYDNESLCITSFGLAEEEGTYGSMVRVKNIASNKIIYARVIGDSLVKIEI